MVAIAPDNVLPYASIEVPTLKRRTSMNTLLRWLGHLIALVFLIVRVAFLGAGYLVIAIGPLSRLLLGVAGALLLLLGGLRWFEVKARLMRGANWVDRTTLRLVRAVTRNPFAQSFRTST